MTNDSLSVSLLCFIAGAIFGAGMAMLGDRRPTVTIVNQPDVAVDEETELDDPDWWKRESRDQ